MSLKWWLVILLSYIFAALIMCVVEMARGFNSKGFSAEEFIFWPIVFVRWLFKGFIRVLLGE